MFSFLVLLKHKSKKENSEIGILITLKYIIFLN